MKALRMAQSINKLGKYIYDKRRALGMSREAFADELTKHGYECTYSAVNHWENGRADAPIDDPAFARALAMTLNVAPSELVKVAGVYDEITPDVTESVLARFSPGAIQLLKEASPKEIKKVEAVIRAMLAEDE